MVDRYATNLTSDSLRTALDLLATTSNNRHGFEVLPGNNQIQQFFLELGFDTDLIKLINTFDFKRKCLPGLWATMLSILNRCLAGKEAGIYTWRFSIYQIFYGVVNQCHFDYASLIWIELVELVQNKQRTTMMKKKNGAYIPFVRLIKILIRDMMKSNRLSARPMYE